MITYHLIDSISIMNAIEIVEQHNWNQTTEAQSNKQEPCDKAALLLRVLRNALSNPVQHKE